MCVFCCLLVVTAATQATNTSPWLANTEHTLTQEKYVDAQAYNKILTQRRGFDQGQQCRFKRIAIRSFTSVNMQYKEGCWYSTKIGLLLSDGTYLLQPGEEVAGHIKGNLLDTATLKPTPNPNVFLDLEPDKATGYGYFVRFRTLESVKFDRTRHATGAVTLEYKKPITAKIERANELMNVQDHYVWYSTEAKYMLIWTERGVLYVYNLNDFTVLPVFVRSKPVGTLKGSAVISNSGRYIAVAIESVTHGDLYVADLDMCNQKPTKAIGVTAAMCNIQSQKSLLKSTVKDYAFPSVPRFFDDYTLGFYHVVEPPQSTLPGINQQPNNTVIQNDLRVLFTIQTYGTTRLENKYMALGDSFSSGEGAGDYDLGTDRPGVNMCHTSKNSYPYVLNNRLNFTEFHSIACSGAIIEDIYSKTLDENKVMVYDYKPGEILQIRYIKQFRPSVVTITISGNDIHFSDRLKYCIVSSPNCYQSYAKRKEIANEILQQHDRLVELYGKILETGINTRLYVVGYPQIVNGDVGASCASNVQLNAYQRIMANDLINYFNAVIKHAAQQAGAFYVGTETALNGHRLCDGASATIGVNGITISGQSGGIESSSKGMYHPNDFGHDLLANAISAKTNGLSEEMPDTGSYTLIPPQPEDYPFLGIEPDGVQPADLYYAHLADTTTIQDTVSADYESINLDVPVAPYTEYEASLHSDPVVIGTLKSDGSGRIRGVLEIPNSVKPGMHELHLRGAGIDGKLIDLYQFVYVVANNNDYDGDGVINDLEPCGIIEPSGLDIDDDGIDDACDTTITPKATQTPATEITQEEDLSYKINGSSPETSPPLEIDTVPRAMLITISTRNNPVSEPMQAPFPVDSSFQLQPSATNTPEVLSANQATKPFSDVRANNIVLVNNSNVNNDVSKASRWIMAIVLFGFTVLLIISYGIYKHGKKAKT